MAPKAKSSQASGPPSDPSSDTDPDDLPETEPEPQTEPEPKTEPKPEPKTDPKPETSALEDRIAAMESKLEQVAGAVVSGSAGIEDRLKALEDRSVEQRLRALETRGGAGGGGPTPPATTGSKRGTLAELVFGKRSS